MDLDEFFIVFSQQRVLLKNLETRTVVNAFNCFQSELKRRKIKLIGGKVICNVRIL